MLKNITFVVAWVLLGIPPLVYAQKPAKPLFTFGVIADVQYCACENNGARHYSASLQKLREAVTIFNQQQVKFVVSLGDFIDRDARSFDTLNKITGQLRMPLHHTLGNHDFTGEPNEIENVPQYLGLKEKYYALKPAGWRFIILNGNDISVLGNKAGSNNYRLAQRRLEELKSQGAPNAQPWNGELSETQFKWLKEELASAHKAKEQVIVFCHHPVAPVNGNLNLWNDKALKQLLESYPNVKAYFNGHAHEGGYNYDQGKHYVTFKGMVEQEENAFGIVEVYKNYLKINGYGAEPNRLLK